MIEFEDKQLAIAMAEACQDRDKEGRSWMIVERLNGPSNSPRLYKPISVIDYNTEEKRNGWFISE